MNRSMYVYAEEECSGNCIGWRQRPRKKNNEKFIGGIVLMLFIYDTYYTQLLCLFGQIAQKCSSNSSSNENYLAIRPNRAFNAIQKSNIKFHTQQSRAESTVELYLAECHIIVSLKTVHQIEMGKYVLRMRSNVENGVFASSWISRIRTRRRRRRREQLWQMRRWQQHRW